MGLFGTPRADLRSEIDQLKFDIEVKDAKIVNLNSCVEVLDANLAVAETNLRASQSVLSTKTRQLEVSMAKIGELQDKIAHQSNEVHSLECSKLASAQWEQQVQDIVGYIPSNEPGTDWNGLFFQYLQNIIEDTRWMDRLRIFISDAHSPAITLDTQPDMVDLKPKKNKKYTRRLAIDIKRKPKK